ncbi:hypothetical protein [Halomonas sp. E19]|uniref:hypothetical protein n=1 Tax=Halomonas sp. E19 TaxID=3397247 RepID=UPI004034BCF4
MVGQEASLARLFLVVQSELQYAAGLPQRLLRVELGQPAPAVQQPGQVGAALQVGIGGQLDVERPCR